MPNPYEQERARAMAFAQVRALRNPKPLEEQSWPELLQTRKAFEGDPVAQQAIAPHEHRAYARQAVIDQPAMAPVMALGAPVYYAAKKLGLASGRTEADTDQIIAGWQGTAQGLLDALKANR